MTLMTRPTTYVLATVALIAGGCSQNMVLGNKTDARPNDGVSDDKPQGSGGASSGGATGTGGSPGTGGRAASGGAGGAVSGTGGAMAASGGRGLGGNGGTTPGTGGRATGGGGAPGSGGQGGGGASDGGAGCNADASIWCASGQLTASGGVSCGDALTQPVCSAGAWTCPTGWMPLSECDCAGHLSTACVCTPSGPSCPDAGADATSDGGMCGFGCFPNPTNQVCGTGKVAWECFGASPNISVLLNGGCTDAGTDAIRYCCAPTFLSQCPPRT